jgi:hypothetical protein
VRAALGKQVSGIKICTTWFMAGSLRAVGFPVKPEIWPISSPGEVTRGSAERQRAAKLLHSARFVAGESHPVHDSAIAVVIVDRVVLGAAIIPEG